MSKSNRLTASLEVPSHSARIGSSPLGSPANSRSNLASYAGSGPTAKYRTPDPVAGLSSDEAATKMTEMKAEMKAELTRLQAKEVVLLKMLNQEREHKFRAEQLVEAEKLVCLELKHRLKIEQKKNCEEELGFSIEDSDNEEEEQVDDCVS